MDEANSPHCAPDMIATFSIVVGCPVFSCVPPRHRHAQLVQPEQLAVMRLAGAQGRDRRFGDRRRRVEIRIADRQNDDVPPRPLIGGGAVMQVPGSDALPLQPVDQAAKIS